MAHREEIWALVAQSCMYLDDAKYDKYLSLATEDYTYTITSFSPDLRRDMVLLSLNKSEIATLLENIHNHVHLPGKLFRQASLYDVEQSQDGLIKATSYLTVAYTDLDGRSAIFCIGRYRDEIIGSDHHLRIKSRRFEMETRDLGTGCHYPI